VTDFMVVRRRKFHYFPALQNGAPGTQRTLAKCASMSASRGKADIIVERRDFR